MKKNKTVVKVSRRQMSKEARVEFDKKIISRYHAGLKLKYIAYGMGIKPCDVYPILRRYGFVPNRNDRFA